jgi:hypothetical protein
MKVFTATDQTQGQRPGDYHWCIPGELVLPPTMICDSDANDPDGGRGCGRGWSGANSHKATTTVVVTDVAGLNLGDYSEAFRSSLEQSGWGDALADDAQAQAEHLAALAASYPIGTVFGHRLGELYVRRIPPASIFAPDE